MQYGTEAVKLSIVHEKKHNLLHNLLHIFKYRLSLAPLRGKDQHEHFAKRLLLCFTEERKSCTVKIPTYFKLSSVTALNFEVEEVCTSFSSFFSYKQT